MVGIMAGGARSPHLSLRGVCCSPSSPSWCRCQQMAPFGATARVARNVSVAAAPGDCEATSYVAVPNGAPGHLTLNQVYGIASESVQIDHLKRRKKRDLLEIGQAAIKLGMNEATVTSRLADLTALLPELAAPNLDRMKASDWAKLLLDVNRVASIIIAVKAVFPGADVSRIVASSPKLLLVDPGTVERNALRVRRMLTTVRDPDAIVEAVPQLLDPAALALALSNLRTWFNTDEAGALAQLQRNPLLLVNIEEADMEADPSYGELTVAG